MARRRPWWWVPYPGLMAVVNGAAAAAWWAAVSSGADEWAWQAAAAITFTMTTCFAVVTLVAKRRTGSDYDDREPQ